MPAEQGPKSEPKIETNRERVLTPEEFKKKISDIKAYFTNVESELGMPLRFPDGYILAGENPVGKTINEALFDSLMQPLETYEPPIIRGEQEEVKEQPTNIPKWLKGHEDLIWTGANDNPRWQAKATQIGEKVSVVYKRRNKEYKPGKSVEEQGRALEPVTNTFNINEWKVAKQIFDYYEDLSKRYEKGEKEARKEYRAIIKEENNYRKGKGAKPVILAQKVKEAIDFIANTTRDEDFLDSIKPGKLTQRIAELLSQLVVLNFTRSDGRERIPKPKKDIKEFPTFSENLTQIAGSLDRQIKDNKGIALILGEPGTGKNEALEYIAGETDRPYFIFACGRGMKAQEIALHYEFDTTEGTKKFLTDFAEGIQTPGALVQVDEYNALKENIQAAFHGVGDSRRTFEYDGIKIPVAEGVVIVFTGNPATGGAAGDMAEALLDRTGGQRVIMEYPALKKGEMIARKEKWSDAVLIQKEVDDNTLRDYACDEALVTRDQFNEFEELSDDEFALLWDVIINETIQGKKIDELKKDPKLANLVEEPLKDHITKLLTGLRDIERVADAWRKYFEKKTGGFTVGISMRGINAVTRRYKETGDVRLAFLHEMDIFRKQPVQGRDEVYAALEELLNDTLGATASTTPANP